MNLQPEGAYAKFLKAFLALASLAWLALSAAQAQTTSYTLGTTALLVGPAAGSSSVVLAVTPPTASWTASTNASWLHLCAANQSGIGSANVIFNYDANSGATRSGTLTVAGQTLTVSQAGSGYVAAAPPIIRLAAEDGLPAGVAADADGNVFIIDEGDGALYEWIAASNALTTLVSSGLNHPNGIALDAAGNVYIADTENAAVKEWTASNGSVTTLVTSGLSAPTSVAVDRLGNIYIADAGNDSIFEWTAAGTNLITLVDAGLDVPFGVAVDVAGNVYIADLGNQAIKEWYVTNSNVVTLVSSDYIYPSSLTVDGSGNVFFTTGIDDDGAIGKWMAANNTISFLNFPLGSPMGVAVDSIGNVYASDDEYGTVSALPFAFVDVSDRLEGLAASNDTWPVALPATNGLLNGIIGTALQPWITINGITNGMLNVAYTSATSNRSANIFVLGQAIPVTQGGPAYSLGATELLEGPSAGIDSLTLGVAPQTATWTAMTSTPWLHLSTATQSGTGSTNVIFNYDANLGATRSGSLIIAGSQITVTQAGSTYIAVGQTTTLMSSGSTYPYGVAVDSAGNVYAAISAGLIEKWTRANNNVTTLVSSGLDLPSGVAVDAWGNVYIADSGNNAIKEWTVANSNVVTLVSSGLSHPVAVAVDGMDNIFVADTGNNTIKILTGSSNLTSVVASGFSDPNGLAVDAAENLYMSGTGILSKWTAANNTVTTLPLSLFLYDSIGLAVDNGGNIYLPDSYFADPSNVSWIEEWSVANDSLTTLSASGLDSPYGVAVDTARNVYIADFDNQEIKEFPYAFVDPTPRFEGLAAGNDILPVVLPATENLLPPFAPSSDQSWLLITGITNGVVSFSFNGNTGPARTAHITVLGQSIPITQGVVGTPPTLTGVQLQGNGVLQLTFTNNPSAAFSVLSSTNLALPLSNWTMVGAALNAGGGQFQFTVQPGTNAGQSFYTVRSP